MAKVTDTRPAPGELVIPRSSAGTSVHREPQDPAVQVEVPAASLGFVVSTHAMGWTYVLWSDPIVIGWSADGWLRRINQRG